MSENSTPKRKWLVILLVISLAVNLLIVGLVLGTFLRYRGHDQARTPPGFVPALYFTLPKSEQKALKSLVSEQRRHESRRRGQDFEALGDALRQTPFDPALVSSLLDEQAQATADLRNALHQEWLARVTAMSDEERLRYAERLEQVIEKRSHRRNKKDH